MVTKNLRVTGENFHLSNFQIVNGCQTSHVIINNKDSLNNQNNIFIPIKLIASQDEEILSKIIIAANTHNEVKKEAFESLEKFHKGLEDFYRSNHHKLPTTFYYERRSKQYLSNDKIPKSCIVTLSEQIYSFLSMFHGVPQSTHRYYGELLNSYKKSANMFQSKDNRDFFELYHIAGVALKKLNSLFYDKVIYKKYKPYKYHILYLSKIIMSEKLSRELSKKEYDGECNKVYNILKDDKKLAKVFISCCKIIEKTLKEFRDEHQCKRKTDFTNKLMSNLKGLFTH